MRPTSTLLSIITTTSTTLHCLHLFSSIQVTQAQPQLRVPIPAHLDQFVFDTNLPLLKCGTRTPMCSWAVKIAPTDLVFKPEPDAIYQATALTMHGPDDPTEYRIRGTFPRVRFFSFQVYTVPSLQPNEPSGHLADFEIEPLPGSVNPFIDPSRGPLDTGAYEVYLTARGDKGYKNEMAAYRMSSMPEGTYPPVQKLNATGDFFLVVMRLFGVDPTGDHSVPYGTDSSLWGFVDPPVVERKAPGSNAWVPLRQCSVEEQQCTDDFISKYVIYPQFLLPFRETPGLYCPLSRREEVATPAFFLYGSRNQSTLQSLAVAFRNSYTTYLYWCDVASKFREQNGHKHHPHKNLLGHKDDTKLVLRIHGRLPITPYGLWNETVVAHWPAYDARYVSFHTMDFALPIPGYSSVDDADMWYHYGPGWDRRYSVVVAVEQKNAEACGLFSTSSSSLGVGRGGGGDDMFLPWARADRQLENHPLDDPGVIYRTFVPKVLRAGPSFAGTSPTDVQLRCVGPNGEQTPKCSDPAFYREVMGENYPTVEVYTCNIKTGVAKRLV